MKTTVTLRKRKRGDKYSLYLDIYNAGQRTCEALGLYLIEEKTKADKAANKETLALAQAVRDKRATEARDGKFGFAKSNATIGSLLFEIKERARARKGCYSSYENAEKHIKAFGLLHKRVSDITRSDADKFARYLESAQLAPNSANLYYTKFKAIMNEAVRRDIISRSPLIGVTAPAKQQTLREYLTEEEVRRFAEVKTDGVTKEVQRAFLFSCVVGLRGVDIKALRWGDIKGARLEIRQEKTKEPLALDFSPQAFKLLGERKADKVRVFYMSSPKQRKNCLARILKAAGITKRITFHCARHTFAVLLLSKGVDIYTLSKLLGHTDIKTTQIYAKIVDEAKRAAILSMPDFLGE